MGWAGFGNGEVLRLAAAHGFAAFVTTDRGIAHQQHLADLPVPVIVMTAFRTRIQELAPLVPRIAGIVAGGLRKDIYLVCAPGLEDQDGRRQR